jgi:pyrophosphate--fructose-6-phosphate 1-phosphotransferase
VHEWHIQELLSLQAEFRNQGGFHLIGSGRDKIESKEQLTVAASVVKELDLDGLVVCGGDDSNTNAAVLAEDFASRGALPLAASAPGSLFRGRSTGTSGHLGMFEILA